MYCSVIMGGIFSFIITGMPGLNNWPKPEEAL